MPAYNEGKNIRETVSSWIKVLEGKSGKSRLVVADSGSTDDTHKILLELKKKYKKLEILGGTNKLHGPKVLALYDYAIKRGADYVFQTDSDGQTNPKEFAKFWRQREEYDVILGHRSKRGDGRIRGLVERVVCLLLQLFFDVRVPDANAPFRIMKSSIIEKYYNQIPREYELPNILLTAYFVRFGERVKFEEISFKPRGRGTNSINLKKIFRIGRESLVVFARFRRDMRRIDPRLARKILHRKIGSVAIVASFVVMVCLALSTSPSLPWNRGEVITDSGVFLTVGTQMKEGLIPYVDTFDHKGPLLYIINYFGVMINGVSGIVIFEFLALFITLFFIYKIAGLKLESRGKRLFLAFVVFSLYIVFNVADRGNLTEEYAMPLIAASLYIYLRYLLNNKASFFSVFLVGCCFSCVALLRLNMIAVWVVFSAVIFVKLLVEKRFKKLGKFVLSFVLGAALVAIPILGWLVAEGAFGAFIDAYVLFNASYAKAGIRDIYMTIISFMGETLLVLGLALTGYYVFTVKNKRDKILFCTYLGAFLASILAACISGRSYPHYAMVLVPLPVFAFAWLYSEVEKNDKNESVSVVLSIFLLFLVIPTWLEVSKSAMEIFSHRRSGMPATNFIRESCGYVEALTVTSDRIAVYGNKDYVYLACNRLPASRYSYQFPIAEIRPSILDEFFDDISRGKPKIFIVQDGYVDERVLNYLKENNYTEEWRETENEMSARIFYLDR